MLREVRFAAAGPVAARHLDELRWLALVLDALVRDGVPSPTGQARNEPPQAAPAG